MINAAAVFEEVAKVAPIHGVSLGVLDDKATWRIDFNDEATQEQRAAGQNAMDAFDADAWEAQRVIETKRKAALSAIAQKRLDDDLAAAMNAKDAPQAVLEYAAALKGK